MTKLHEVVKVDRPQAEAFEFLADFANAERWDPGTVRSVPVGGGGRVGVGSTFDLTVRFRGRTMPMRYRIERYEPARLVALTGTGDRVEARDEIRFEPDGRGTRITYEAELRLTGLARLAGPFVRESFRKLGAEAARGIAEALDPGSVRRAG
jgi:carbon monoxide dehydrogenase subunit G